MMHSTSRRSFLLGGSALAAFTLAGCATTPRSALPPTFTPPQHSDAVRLMYAARPEEPYPVPAVPLDELDPRYVRQIVDYDTAERPGTVVVDTPSRYLYWTLEGGRAIRYGIGIGRDGFAWGGRAKIAYKRAWPTWTPPAEMIVRQPELAIYRNGMPPGYDNPLGARALYIFENGRDTLYRLHGTHETKTIGQAVSSGCVRLLFQDVIDLHSRVPDGSPLVVLQ